MNGKKPFDRFDFNYDDLVDQNIQSESVFETVAFVRYFDLGLPDDT